jgi:hypothetical protein
MNDELIAEILRNIEYEKARGIIGFRGSQTKLAHNRALDLAQQAVHTAYDNYKKHQIHENTPEERLDLLKKLKKELK